MANCQEICSTDPSKSQNNDSAKGKSVTVLLPSDVTVGKRTGEVLMPNTIEMAQIKKLRNGRFKTGIHFSSKMSEKDVEKTLQDEFDILKNQRFCCASAADGRTKLNFHGEKRVWDGRFIKRNITGNSALYILIELEETNTSGLTWESGESHAHQQPTPGPSNQKLIPPGTASVAVSRPFNKKLFPNPISHLKRAFEKRKTDSETVQQESSSQQSHPGLAKQKKRNGLNVVFQQKNQKKSSSTTVTPHSGSTDLQQTKNQVLMCQTLGDNVTKSGIFSWQNLLPAVPKSPLGTTPLLGTTVGNSSQQVQHCDKTVAGNIGMQVLSQASQQSSKPMKVMLPDLSISTSTMALGGPPQHWPMARVHSEEHETTDPREPVPLGKEQQYRTVPHVHREALKSVSQCSKHDQRSVAQASQNPVSTTSHSQQRELIAQASKYGSPLQQAPPASTKKPSVSERQREILPHERQEFLVLFSASDEETSDSAFDSMLENDLNHDTVQSRDIVHKIHLSPCKGSTKGGDKFNILLEDVLPEEIDPRDCVACFENCGTVQLDQTVNFLTLGGRTPKSLQGPGPVNVRLMTSDGSWQGGKAVFEYIDDPPTFGEFLCKVVTDRDMRRELFNTIDKEMSSIKPSDGQATGSCGETGPGSSSISHSKCAWSAELLRLLVYKAAEIGGGEFIQIIFSTSARKVVFNSYKNSATLPEDVARTNGHLALANYLQDVNSSLSIESNSDAGTESIDWLELKHAVDEEQSLTSGTDEAQILRKSEPPAYTENDDDDETDYFADDEISPSSSPCHSNVFDSENEAQSQNSKDSANGNQSPVENSYRSFHFNSLASKAEVEQDLKREVLVVDLPPGNGGKEMLVSVEPEQRAHANNNNEESSVQDPEEQLKDLYNDLRVQATNNKKNSTVQDPAGHLRDQDDDASVHRRNNDGPLPEAPEGETDDERADSNDVLRQDRSGDGSHQGQGWASQIGRRRSPVVTGTTKPGLIINPFQAFLERLSLDIEQDELEGLKFLLMGNIPLGILEKCLTPRELFTRMMQASLLGDDNLDNLQQLFTEARRSDLAERVRDFKQSSVEMESELPAIESSCEREVNKEDNLPVENDDLSELLLHLDGNKLEVILSMKIENAGYKLKQLDCDEVKSLSSGDDITEKGHESTVLCCGKVENWDTFGGEVISEIEEASTGTTSSHTATHKCHNVVVTYGSESDLDGKPTELRMIDKGCNDENSRSRDIVTALSPNKGSTKGGDQFHVILRRREEIASCKAIFQGCGEVCLEKTSVSTLAGTTPGSQHGPGKVRVTPMSLDESWWGGESDFLYIEDPPTKEDFISKVVENNVLWGKLLDRMSKEMMISSKPSDGQASDSSGKTVPERKTYGTTTQFKKIKR